MEEQHPMRSILREHIGIVLAVLSFATVLIKLWVIARGSPTSALTILSTIGLADATAGIVLAGLPIALLFPFMVAVNLFAEGMREGDRGIERGRPAVLFAGGAFAFFAPALIAATFVGFAVVFTVTGALWARFRRSRWPRTPKEFNPRLNGAAVAAIAWLAFVGVDTPWLPAERIDPPTSRPFTGYVLDSERMLVLRSRDRVVVEVSADSERQLCSKSSGEAWQARPLAFVILGVSTPNYPLC